MEPTLIVMDGDDLNIKLDWKRGWFMMNEEWEVKLIKGKEKGFWDWRFWIREQGD